MEEGEQAAHTPHTNTEGTNAAPRVAISFSFDTKNKASTTKVKKEVNSSEVDYVEAIQENQLQR